MIETGRFDPAQGNVGETSRSIPLMTGNSTHVVRADQPDQLRKTMLFDLGQIDIRWDEAASTLWAFMTPQDRPNFNPQMLRDAHIWLTEAKRLFDAGALPIKYMVAGSRFPGVFNLGGDLELFAACIERQDLPGLIQYGHACIDMVHRCWRNADMPIVSVALAQGDAMGGGFEALLCFDIVIAERRARFGLPEILFGLFPGMGAYSILARKLGRRMAERMLMSGKIYTAEEMYDLGIVTKLVEDGEGEEAVRDYVRVNTPHHPGHVGIFEAGRRVDALELPELRDIVENWASVAMKLERKDLRMMRRLAAAQIRLSE